MATREPTRAQRTDAIRDLGREDRLHITITLNDEHLIFYIL
jgi:hypothetical protein